MLTFLSTQGLSGAQAVRYFFFDSKPMQKASFDHFKKSQEFSGLANGWILCDTSDLKVGGLY